MDSNVILVALCSLVIFSYVFDLVAGRTKVPSALLLLTLGIALQLLANSMGYVPLPLLSLLPVLGTIGLILIVLEGALELRFDPQKLGPIARSFASAVLGLGLSVAAMATFIVVVEGASIHTGLITAVPLGVISSAIAIPSVRGLHRSKKEFIVYESSFSDILGVMLFNFVEQKQGFTVGSAVSLGSELVLILLIAAASCLLLLYVLGHISHHVKFFLLITILVLIYSVGKLVHLPSLVVVLLFGLFLNNTDLIKHAVFSRLFIYPGFRSDLHLFSQLTAESAFIIRTFFFLIFGFTIELGALTHTAAVLHGVIFLTVILALRYAVLRLVAKEHVMPEVFVAPRGLISIVLFLSVPVEETIPGYRSGLLFFIVLVSCVLMSFGLIHEHRTRPIDSGMEQEPPRIEAG